MTDVVAGIGLAQMKRYKGLLRVELVSEFRYRKMSLNKNSLVIVISQSGETADTLAALRLAKEKGITTFAVVNVVGSSIAREADNRQLKNCIAIWINHWNYWKRIFGRH